MLVADRYHQYINEQITWLSNFDELYGIDVYKFDRVDNLDPDFFSIKPDCGFNDQLAVEIKDYVKYTANGLAFLDRLEN